MEHTSPYPSKPSETSLVSEVHSYPSHTIDKGGCADVLDWARRYVNAGFAVIPVRADGSKAPSQDWKCYQQRLPTEEELTTWFSDGGKGIGIVGGAVSGNLERIDFDSPGVLEEWTQLCRELGLADVAKKCPIVRTPRDGGFHVYYRCSECVEGNQKLAQAYKDADAGATGEFVTLIETRGEGGYTLAPGSPAGCHSSGSTYRVAYGDIFAPPVLSADERMALLQVARALSRYVQESQQVQPADHSQARPGDEYNLREDWRGIMLSRGWVIAGDRGGVEYWRRPGKGSGVSATFNHAGRRLFHIFSTNAYPLEDGKSYSPFAIYTILKHQGDFAAAAKALTGTKASADAGADTESRTTVIRHAIEQGTAKAIYDVVTDLAELPLGECTDLIREIKSACPSIDLRGLKGQIGPARSTGRGTGTKTEDERPVLAVGDCDLMRMGDEALSHLEMANTPPRLFVRSGSICSIVEDENGLHSIKNLTASDLVSRVAKCCAVEKMGKYGPTPTIPPASIAEYILSEGAWPFPALEGITASPTVRPDGTIAETPGYDPATRLFYKPSDGLVLPVVPDTPDANDLRAALETIDDIVCDFPFVDPASKANFIALLLTTVIRPAVSGQIPLALLDAPTAGSGKSLLSAIVGIVATGRYPEFTTAPKSEEEWAKKLTAILFSGQPVVILDNLKYMLSSDDLAAMLTCRTWFQRVFGKNTELVMLPNRAIWVATGNNVQVGGDIARRCYWIRLDPEMAKPHERTGFRHANLTEWVEANRGRIIAALLTMYRSWYAAGQAIDASVPVVGSFEQWARIVGSVLSHVGIQGFLANRDQLWEQADNESDEWEAFLSAWVERYGDDPVRVRQIMQDISSVYGGLSEAVPATLADAFEGKGQNAAKKIGWAFRNRLERRYGTHGLRLVKGPNVDKVATWRVLFDTDPRPVDETSAGLEDDDTMLAQSPALVDPNYDPWEHLA